MYETIKSLSFVEEILGDESGLVAKVKGTDFYFSWDPHDNLPIWDQGGDMEGSGEEVDFDQVFDSCPEIVREQLVYHLDLFTAKVEE